MDKPKFRLLLVDDHPAFRESIAAAVEEFFPKRLEVAGQCGDAPSAVQLAGKLKPHAVVLDLGLPGMGGMRALAEIRRVSPASRLIVFSMYDDQGHVVDAIRAGADDYLFKAVTGAREAAERILMGLEQDAASPDRVREHVYAALRAMGGRALAGGDDLTETELRVLGLAAFEGRSMKEIARILSAGRPPLSERTVRKHLENIYDKLGARSQAHAVCLAIKHGLLAPDSAVPAREEE